MFEQLSVFAGGCTLEAAEAVCGGGRNENDSSLPALIPQSSFLVPDVADGIAALVDSSLMRQEEAPDGEPRFQMLETIREFGRERLAAGGEEDRVRREHALFFLSLAEVSEPELGVDPSWLDGLELEHDNLRAALDWCAAAAAERIPYSASEVGGTAPDSAVYELRTPHYAPRPTPAEIGLRLAAALGEFWTIRNHATEGRQRLATALAGSEGVPLAVRAKALRYEASFALVTGDLDRAETRGEESLALFRQVGDPSGAARVLTLLSEVAANRGDMARAAALAGESLTLHRQVGNERGTANATTALGCWTFQSGERERGLALLREALALSRTSGDRLWTANVLRNLGLAEMDLGHSERAMALFVESRETFREFGAGVMGLITLTHLVQAARSTGDQERVSALLEEGLAASRGLEGHRWVAPAVGMLAEAARRQGDPRIAKPLFNEMLALARDQGDPHQALGSLYGLTQAALAEGNLERARALLAEGESICRAVTDPKARIHPLGGMGHIARALGEFERAAAWYRESLELHLEFGAEWEIIQSLEDHAILAARQGHWALAARLLGAVETQCAGLGRTPPATYPDDYERALAATRAAMGEEALEAAWAEGRALSPEEAARAALAAE